MSSLIGSGGFATGSKKPKIPGYDVNQIGRLSPEQQQLFQHLFSGSLGGIDAGLANLGGLAAGDESQFNALEAPALRQFSGLQGNIASRFSGGLGQGGLGARHSSGFQNTENAAAQSFAEQLQSQRVGLQQNAIQQLLGLGKDLLGTQTFDNVITPKGTPWWQDLLSGLGGAAGGVGAGAGNLAFLKHLGLL